MESHHAGAGRYGPPAALCGARAGARGQSRGEQKWFAQCGFEATSVTWLFPGERVRIDVACLDCGDPLTVEMLDGQLTRVDPPTVVGHLNYGFGPSRGRTPYL